MNSFLPIAAERADAHSLLTDDIRKHDTSIQKQIGYRLVIIRRLRHRDMIARLILRIFHEFVDFLNIHFCQRGSPIRSLLAVSGNVARLNRSIALAPSSIEFPARCRTGSSRGRRLPVRFVQSLAKCGREHGVDDVSRLTGQSRGLLLTIFHEVVVNHEESGREKEYEDGTRGVYGRSIGHVLILEFLRRVHDQTVGDEIIHFSEQLLRHSQIGLEGSPQGIVFVIVQIPLSQKGDFVSRNRVAVLLVRGTAEHADHSLDVVGQNRSEEGIPRKDDADASDDIAIDVRNIIIEFVEDGIKQNGRGAQVLVLHQLQNGRQRGNPILEHVVQCTLSIFLSVQIEHDRLLIGLNGSNLPYGDHDVFVPGARGEAGVVDDVSAVVSGINSEGHGAVVGPREGGIRRDEAVVSQDPRRFLGVRFPLQSVDVLGDDGVEGERPSVGQLELPSGLLLKIRHGGIGPNRMGRLGNE